VKLLHVARAVTPLLAIVALAGCSRLTDVDAPDLVTPASVANALGAETLRVGAINGFALVFAGAEQGQITTSGTMADEFYNVSTPFISLGAADIRLIPEPSTSYPYQAVQRARLDIERATQALQQYAPTPRSKTGELFALSGYTRLFLGENMCSGIPLGTIVDGNLIYGEPLTTQQLFEQAAAAFDSSLSYSQDTARILNLGRVGKGRALLNLGRFAEAAAAVAAVPTPFTYTTFHAQVIQPNGVFAIIANSKWLTVADREGVNGLNFRTASDPRVPVTLLGKGIDGTSDLYLFSRYSSLASPVILASGVEARLIEAEASLKAGDPNRALDILNTLRATVSGLPPLALQATPDARVDQIFRERAFWLFATGHRHGDLRRLIRQYGRSQATVFPVGDYKSGLQYGSDVTFAPDANQLSNPSYKGCLNRNA
jgi:hypothetical protein